MSAYTVDSQVTFRSNCRGTARRRHRTNQISSVLSVETLCIAECSMSDLNRRKLALLCLVCVICCLSFRLLCHRVWHKTSWGDGSWGFTDTAAIDTAPAKWVSQWQSPQRIATEGIKAIVGGKEKVSHHVTVRRPSNWSSAAVATGPRGRPQAALLDGPTGLPHEWKKLRRFLGYPK